MFRRPSLLLLATLLVTAAQAQAPREIPYQGTLADGGAPVTAATSVVFRLHDAATGGEVLWAESQTVTPDADGRFTARLGSVADLPGSFDQPLWLSVTADGTALGPRTPLGASPVALALYGVRVEPPVTVGYAPAIATGHPSNAAGEGAVVAGGGVNNGPNLATGPFAVVSGGLVNQAAGAGATVGGGQSNEASDAFATVSGGYFNEASGVLAAVGGGDQNEASGSHATVPGGEQNRATGSHSFAAGRRARADHDGTFVWADRSASPSFASTGDNQFLVRAAGGVGIGTAVPGGQLHVETGGRRAGVFLNDGSSGINTATVFAENAGTTNGTVGWFEGNGTGQVVVANQNGSGDLYRGIQNGNLRFRVQANGDVTADGTFTGGGADLAEFFPLADGASAAPGQVVGLRRGRVSLSTDGAEQVAVISSNPAFIGNPDAEAGGALVALVGQVAVDVSGDAAPGDLLVASGDADGRARAVSPADYQPADGAVLGRVLTADGDAAIALVGVDEAAALRGVVVRQAERLDRQQATLDQQAAKLDALLRRLETVEARLAPHAMR